MRSATLAMLAGMILLMVNTTWCQGTTVPHLNLFLLKGRFAVCRLAPKEQVPAWAFADGPFSSVTRTSGELSIVCKESAVPKGAKHEPGWRILKVEGPLDFALTGVLASMVDPLAKAGVSIFAISTFDTDYLMVKEQMIDRAVKALRAAGHQVKREWLGRRCILATPKLEL